MLTSELDQLNLFLKDNALLLVIIAVSLVILSILVIFLSGKHHASETNYDDVIRSLGGKNNIVCAKSNGSRVAITLIDDSLVDFVGLKKAGIEKYIKMTKKITILVGSDSSKLSQTLNIK
jgi:phosphotransferase system IIB component